MHVHWAISVSTGAMVRVVGMMTYVLVSSWIMNENLFTIALTQVYALLVTSLSLFKISWRYIAPEGSQNIMLTVRNSQSSYSKLVQFFI